jgi:uncharacterized protein DUF6493
MTGDELEGLCRTAAGRAELVARLASMDEDERAALAPAVSDIVDYRRPRDEFDGAAVAIAAIGVLSDVHQIAVWGIHFQTIAVEAEPLVVQALADRAPRWERRLLTELLDDRFGSWRLVWRLVRAGRVPWPRSPDFLAGAVSGMAGVRGPSLKHTRSVSDALAEEPELVEQVVWPVLTTQGTGRALARHDQMARPGHLGWSVDPTETWIQALLDAVQRGAIDRGQLIDAALSALLVDWPKVDHAWFVRLHEALSPSLEELAERSATYLRLPAASYGPAAAMGQRRLRALMDAGLAPVEDILSASPPALLRAEKHLVLGQLALLEVAAAREPERAATVAGLALLATEHAKTDVQQRARGLAEELAPTDSAPPVAIAVVSPAAHLARPEPPDLVPVADAEELIDLTLRTWADPSGPALERVWEGLVRLGRRLSARELAALWRSLSEARAGGPILSLFRGVVWHLAHDRAPNPVDARRVNGTAVHRDAAAPAPTPWLRPEHVVALRAHEIATMAYAGDAALLSFPSTLDGSLRIKDLRARLTAVGSARPHATDAGLAALRVHPDERARSASLRGTPAGDAIADGIDWLAARTTSWERVTWRLPWSMADEPAVWQDSRAAEGSAGDAVAALLDLHDMASRFTQSQNSSGDALTLAWPLLLPHHPEHLAAHAHTRVVGALLATITTRVDAKNSGAVPLLAAIGAARTPPGVVACSALGYGMSAPSALDRATATDALIELGTHGLLGSELGPQLAQQLTDGHVTGSRIAAALDDAARALGPLGRPILDILEALLPVMHGRRDAHLFVDLTARVAHELGRTVLLPAPLRDLAASRARSVLADACRRVPTT